MQSEEGIYTTGQVAAALGEPRQSLVDMLRRTALLENRSPSGRRRLVFKDALTLAVAKTLGSAGMRLETAAFVARVMRTQTDLLCTEVLQSHANGNDVPALMERQKLSLVARVVVNDATHEFGVTASICTEGRSFLPDDGSTHITVPLAPLVRRLIDGLLSAPTNAVLGGADQLAAEDFE